MGEITEDDIKGLVYRFNEDSVAAVSELRALAQQAPAQVHKQAGRFLLSALDRKEGEILAQMLLAAEIFPPLVCDPAIFSSAEAVAVSRFATRVESQLDSLLARWLATQKHLGAEEEQRALRCLAILSEIAAGDRSRPLLIQLLRSMNRRVRSKAAMVIGGLHSNVNWFLDLIRKGDPRVAANALEGAWNTSWNRAGEVFWEGVRSPHPRVAGNAAVGLYLMGEKLAALRELERMAMESDARMRATAAWAMGELGNPVMLNRLRAMARDESAAVRRNALRALARIRNRTAAAPAPSIPANVPAVPPPS